MSCISCSESDCSWARCSGLIELSIAWAAAIRRAIASINSSKFCGFSGKKSPYCSMNCSKPGSSPRSVALDHLVQRGHHVLHPRHVLGGHVLHAFGHLVDVALHQLLAELVHQLLEPALGLAGGEVVALQLLDPSGQVVGEHVEAEVALRRGLAGELGPPLVPGLLGVAGLVVDRVAFLVDDVGEFVGDLGVDPTEVAAVADLLALAAELVHQLAQPGDALTVAILEALLHHPAQGVVQITVVEQVVGDLLEHRLGVDVEPALGPVPP